MATEERKPIILYVIDVLKKYIDENHSLTYAEIGEKIKEDFDVETSYKTVARIITSLIEYGLDIVKKGKNGCSLYGRSFDNSQLSFLIDAIFSSKSITSDHAQKIIEELMKDCSIYEKKKYDYIYKANEIARTHNKSLFYTVDTIQRAIENGKQIKFTYNEILPNKKLKTRYNGKEYIINPYFMINNRGKYYLVCNYDKYNNISNYKIECISNISTLDTPIKPIAILEGCEDFDVSTYVNEHVYMFSGQTINANIKVDNAKLINDIVDWYGDNIDIKEKEDGIYISLNVNEQAFLYWSLQYGQNIEIIKPVATRKKYISMLQEIIKKYKKEEE